MDPQATERPAYRVLAEAGFFGPDSHLYREGEKIYYDDEPNDQFEPLNEPARRRMRDFFDKLDAHARKAAEKAGREYTGRPRSLEDGINLARQDMRQVQLVQGGPGVPLMGGRPETAAHIERLEPDPVPDTGRRPPGRPKGSGKLSIEP